MVTYRSLINPSKTMKIKIILATLIAIFFLTGTLIAQQPLVKRVISKNDRFDFGVGGTLAVTGAPKGSVRIEGWNNREVEITAEIEIEAPNEKDIDRIAAVTGFALEESLGRVTIVSIGLNDQKRIRKTDKKFPKTLYTMPFKIDYVIKVPRYTDVQIDGGTGDLFISGIDGTMRVNYLETNANIELTGGSINATFGAGNVDIKIPSSAWRGRFADVQLASGTLNLLLPTGISSQFDAVILRTGSIENNFEGFSPRDRREKFSSRSIVGKSGAGTIPLKFTVGDGNLKISEIGKPS